MLTPSTATVADYTAAVKADKPYHIRITFLRQNVVLTDADIVAGSFTLQSYMNPDTDLTIGRAVMDEVNFQIINSNKLTDLIWNQEFTIEFGLEVGLITDYVTIGHYIGSRPDKVNNVDVIHFTAHDLMSKFDVLADQWIASLTYPMTMSQMYASLCSFVGVTSDAGDELSNMKNRIFTQAPITADGLMCRKILAAMAEAMGCVAKMNADGHVQMKWFSDQQSYTLGASDEFAVESVDLQEGYLWKDLEDNTWEELEAYRWVDLEGYNGAFLVNSVTVKLTEDDIGVSYPSHSGMNDYLIIDNPFLRTGGYADVQLYVAPLYARLNGFGGYLPIRVTVVGNALVEAGDVITVDVGGKNYRLPVFNKVMNWNGGLTDDYESTGEIERQAFTAEQKQLLEQGGRYHIFKNDIDELYSELYDPTTGDVSILNQTASEMSMSAAGIDLQAGKYININSQSEIDVKSGGKIDIESGGDIDIESGADINIKSGGKFNVESGGDMEIKSGGSLSIVSGGAIDVNTNNFVIDSANKKMKSENWTFDNNGLSGEFVNSLHPEYVTNFKIMQQAPEAYGYPPIIISVDDNVGLRLIQTGNGIELSPSVINSGVLGDISSGRRWQSINCKNLDVSNGVNAGGNSYFNYIYYDYLYPRGSTKDIKHDIQEMKPQGDRIDKLKPVTYVYDDDKDEKARAGLIYEDTINVMPEICTCDESNKNISYIELIPILLKEIQDLRARVKALEEREGN